MSQIYLFAGGASSSAGEIQQDDPFTAPSPARSKWRFLSVFTAVMLFWCLGSFTAFAQTTHINPATDGGFNNGATFAANGWTVANSANNPWIVGAGVTSGAIGGNSAYVSTNGTSNTFTNTTPAVNYFYRDITVPAGETKIKLSFNWINNGETNPWDVLQVFVAPTTVTPAASVVSAGNAATTLVPPGIAGATGVFLATTLQTTTQTATVFLPSNLAGTTFRLIFSWRNDDSGGANPSGTVDNISLTSAVPGTFTSIVSGNYGAPSTWDANDLPSQMDNIIISAGHTVTVDATGQAANNATVNGILAYGATPTSFAVKNLTVNAGGTVNVFNGTTGKTLTVGGDLVNNGTIDVSVGTTTAGTLIFNGTTVQTISGTGAFVNNKIRNLAFSNTSTAIPNINWMVNNLSVEYNLNINNAKINLGANTFTYGTSATLAGNTFDCINGGFMAGGKFARWWTAAGTGYTTQSPTAIPNGSGGRYPFYTPSGVERIFYLGRNTPTAGGIYAVKYNDAATVTTGLNIADGTYTITDRWDGNFVVTTEGTTPVANSYMVTVFATNAFYPANTNTRVMLQNAPITGQHFAGTVIPSGQRQGVSLADLTSATGLYLGINNTDIPFHPTVSGNWNDASIWNKGSVPGCNDLVTVPAGLNLTVNSAGNSARNMNIIAGGTLTIASGDLTIGCTGNNASMVTTGTLTVTGGTLTVNGNMHFNIASTFNQSGGNINIDGNNAGDTATSVASGTALLYLNGSNNNWTGGTLTIVDPHAATTATNALTCAIAVAQNMGANHTFRLGNGVSTDAGGSNTFGFRISTNNSTGRLALGNLQLSTAGGTNRFVTTASGFGITGNLTIDPLSEFRDTAVTIHVAGNVVNNGTYVGTGTLAFQNNANGGSVAVTTAQSLSGTGTFANALTTPSAKLVSLTVNNTSASGVTLDVPMTLSGTLTLTAGKLNTSSANLLTINGTTAGSIAGGNANAYVNGPLARTIVSGNAATTFVNFPVGKGGAYAPIALAPVTTAVTVIKAEAFDTNTGTANASIINLANNRRWETSIVSGAVTSTNVRIGDANLVAGKIPVTAPSASGEYTATFGSLATFAMATAPAVPTVTGNAGIPIANYSGFVSYAESNVCSGTPAPGVTIASTNNICLGTSVNLSVAAATTGTGVTYQWQSSPDGVAYTDIDTATNPTLTVTPTAATYYQLKVTCATGPATGTSTPILVAFANSVVTTVPAARCGLGTVTLGATPSAGATIAWYDAATNGNLVGNGNTFITPSISANKTYYAVARTTTTGMATVGAATTLTGAIDQPSAFVNRWGSHTSQTIFTAADLTAAGLSAGDITSMAYNITNLGDGATNGGFTVRIATVGAGTFANTTFLTTGFATVYGPQTYTHTATGWQTINFSTPYTWDGTSNIVVEVKMTGADLTNNSQTYFTATTGNTVLWANSLTATTGTLSANRLNVMFGGQAACNSARVPVLATVNTPPALTLSATAVPVCAGQSSAAVTLTSNAGDYDSYVWSPATGVSGDAATGWTFNPAVSTVYTLTASQTAGSQCVATTTAAVTVNAVPSAISIASVPATNCTNTAVALAATGGAVDVTATIGTATTLTGNTEQPTAFNNRFSNYWNQTIYTAAELNAMGIYAGKIKSMAYEVATLGDGATNAAFTVKIGATSATSFANNTFLATTAYATVFGPVTYTHTATGWQTITFATPYDWDGVSNLVINVTMNGANLTNNTQTYYTATTDDTTLSATAFTGSTTTGTLSKKRLNVRFTATNNGNITWSPDTNLFTDAAATVPYVAGTNAATVYVKSAAAANTTYTATSTATGNCTATQTVGVNIVDCGIVWGNLQWPTSATITTCGTETAYGQVYKTNVTEAAGQGAGMKAWVGVSTANTDPATWTEATWNQATFNVQAGNNDEFKYDMTGLTAGTYYYAFRYQYESGAYYYGGYNAGGGGAWDGTTNVSGVLTVNAVAAPAAVATQTFCNSGTVANLATTSGTGIKWYADATGGTALDGTTALVNGENYFASQTVSNCEGTARTEVVVTITTVTVADPADVIACGSYTLPALNTGNYFTAANGGGTQLNAGAVITSNQTIYVYAVSGTCSAEQSFTVTINNIEADAPANVTVCNSYTLPALTVGNYFTATNGGGTQLNAGDVITTNQTIYVYAATSTTPMCTDENSFTVTVNSIDVVAPANVTVCSSYTLPVLTTGNYFTATGGTGTQLNAGDVITIGQTIYVYAASGTTPNCTDEESFTITIGNFTIADPADVNVCNSYTLPALNVGEYRSAANGGGVVIPAGTVITTDQTVYVYAQSTGTPVCTAEQSFFVDINSVAAPTGASQQAINSDPADATIEDIVTNETGVIWFATEANALAGTPALAAGTQVTAGTTYWGILTDGTCISAPFAVTITAVAGTKDVNMASFSYFPNPVKDVLNVKYTSDITSVEIFNMIGQKVLNKNINAAEGSVDMSQLADGTYIVNVTAGGAVKTIKVVKKQ